MFGNLDKLDREYIDRLTKDHIDDIKSNDDDENQIRSWYINSFNTLYMLRILKSDEK